LCELSHAELPFVMNKHHTPHQTQHCNKPPQHTRARAHRKKRGEKQQEQLFPACVRPS